MKKAVKKIGKILLGIVAVIAVFLLGTCVYDKICLASEKDLLENQIYGQKVEVDGHRMSVYVSGEGKHTLVFMAGSGDSGPIFSFKDFADRFEDCRVVIIERFGYGFSDGFDGPRDVETRVSQDRKALEAAGVEGPFILCPHSYSGLETVYWAQNFPEEVEAIVGLDMAVPATYDTFDDSNVSQNNSSNALMRTLRKMGIVRLLAGSRMGKEFSPEEEKTAMALVCSRYCNETYDASSVICIRGQSPIVTDRSKDFKARRPGGAINNICCNMGRRYPLAIHDKSVGFEDFFERFTVP